MGDSGESKLISQTRTPDQGAKGSLHACNAQAQAQAQATCADARLSWRPLKGRLRRAGVLRAPSVAAESRKELEVIGSSSSSFILCSPDAHPIPSHPIPACSL